MKVNDIIQEGPLDTLKGHWANFRQGMTNIGNRITTPSDATYAKRTHKRLYNDWLSQSRQDSSNEPNYDVNAELLAFANQSFPSVVTKIPAPKAKGINDFTAMSAYIEARTKEYYNSLNQPQQAQQPALPPAAPAAPAAAPAQTTPAMQPGRTASPSRMVRSHPYNGRGYSYDVINNQWTDNYTNKIVTDPQLIDNINISYNRANQRVTPYNMTPAQKAAQIRARKQQQATQRAQAQLASPT
jgi:hypothetical protein